MKIIFIFSFSGMFRDVPGGSGMFQNIPECSVFRVIFIDAHDIWLFAQCKGLTAFVSFRFPAPFASPIDILVARRLSDLH